MCCMQGEAAAAQAAEEDPAAANTAAALGQQSGLHTGMLGSGNASSRGVAAASMVASVRDKAEVPGQEVAPGAQSAGSQQEVPPNGKAVLGPQIPTVPVTAAPAKLSAEHLEQQARPDSVSTSWMLVHCGCLASCTIHAFCNEFAPGI